MAAAAIGCTIAQIAKSIVFRASATAGGPDRAAVVITSGINQVDSARAAAVLGVTLSRADATWVREMTGFAVGGVSPIGFTVAPLLLVDQDLMRLEPIWAAAGSPLHVFRTEPAWLLRLTGAPVADIRAE